MSGGDEVGGQNKNRNNIGLVVYSPLVLYATKDNPARISAVYGFFWRAVYNRLEKQVSKHDCQLTLRQNNKSRVTGNQLCGTRWRNTGCMSARLCAAWLSNSDIDTGINSSLNMTGLEVNSRNKLVCIWAVFLPKVSECLDCFMYLNLDHFSFA